MGQLVHSNVVIAGPFFRLKLGTTYEGTIDTCVDYIKSKKELHDYNAKGLMNLRQPLKQLHNAVSAVFSLSLWFFHRLLGERWVLSCLCLLLSEARWRTPFIPDFKHNLIAPSR